MKNKRNKLFNIVFPIAIFLFIVTVFVISFILIFSSRFFYKARFNGVDVSFKTSEQVFKLLKEEKLPDFVIYEDGAVVFVLESRNFINVDIKKEYIDSILNANLFQSNDIIYDFERTVDKIYLYDLFKDLNKERIKSEDAYVDFDDTAFQYYIQKEILGNEVDIDKLVEKIEADVKNNFFSLELSYFYTTPAVSSSDANLAKQVNEQNKKFEAVINYELLDGETLTLDINTFKNWIYLDDSGNIKFNDNEINAFVKELSSMVNTVGIPRKFTTSAGKTIDIDGGLYGYLLNEEAEFEQIKKDILSASVVNRKPLFSQQGNKYSKNSIGDTYIEVDIDNQHIYCYKEGELALECDVVTGTASYRWHTLTGVFYISGKVKNTYLRGPTWNNFVQRFMSFTRGGQGFHDAPWRSSFGGNTFETSGSHGCVNMPTDEAIKLYDLVDVGCPVVIYSDKFGYFDD